MVFPFAQVKPIPVETVWQALTPRGKLDIVYRGIILGMGLCLTISICSIPTILYISLSTSSAVDVESARPVNCTSAQMGPSVNASTECTAVSWGGTNSNDNHGDCSPGAYTGSVCRQQLMTWQECVFEGIAEDIIVDHTLMEQSQQERERDIAQFLYFLSSDGSGHCQRVAGLVACQSSFPLCDCVSGQTYLASREECERISMLECEEEWTRARQYGIQLPNCTTLPEEATNFLTAESSSVLPPLNITNLTCRDDFFVKNFTCLPLCKEWDSRPYGLAHEIVHGICASLTWLFSGLFLLIFFLRGKVLLIIPTIFLLYFNIAFFIQSTFELVRFIGGRTLYCSSMDAIEAIASPTVYCIVELAVLTFMWDFMSLNWLIHISFIFYKIVFPMHALRSQPYFKWIHLCLLIGEIIIGIIGSISIVLTPGVKLSTYTLQVCTNDSISYYNSTLPMSIIIAIGICMLTVVGGVINKKMKYQAELKITIFFVYFLFCALFVISRDSVYLAFSDAMQDAVNSYFLCESVGYVPGSCSRESFERYLLLGLDIMFHFTILLLPIVNLVFVINFTLLKEKLNQLKCKQFLPKFKRTVQNAKFSTDQKSMTI